MSVVPDKFDEWWESVGFDFCRGLNQRETAMAGWRARDIEVAWLRQALDEVAGGGVTGMIEGRRRLESKVEQLRIALQQISDGYVENSTTRDAVIARRALERLETEAQS